MRSFTITSIKKSDGSKVNYNDGRFVGENPGAVVKNAFLMHIDIVVQNVIP